MALLGGIVRVGCGVDQWGVALISAGCGVVQWGVALLRVGCGVDQWLARLPAVRQDPPVRISAGHPLRTFDEQHIKITGEVLRRNSASPLPSVTPIKIK